MTTIALITGANRGLGLEIARQLGRSGATVILGARDAAAGETVAAALIAEGLDARAVALDVTSNASVHAAARVVAERHGRLDVLVNNAGILPEATAAPSPEAVDVALFELTFATNVFGAVRVTEAFLPLLRCSSAGCIVNVSSTMGSLTDQSDPTSPYFGVVVPAYQASKAALNGVTVALAKRLHDTAITVNSVCPGWVQTDLGGPDNRAAAPLTAAEAARVVVDNARLGAGGPTGRFVDRDGVVAW
jgi:NAD(P)-dependent dehydrogenase (short-subunit alcohol dehydrogenase family)